MIYDINGVEIFDADSQTNRFKDLITWEYKRDDITDAFYTLLKIPQTNFIGEKQYPFVLWSAYPNRGTEATLQLNLRKNYLVAINAGKFTVSTGIPEGTVIQNGRVLRQGSSSESALGNYTLTIDSTGRLSYAEVTDNAETLIANGIVSAVSGFIPLISNYEDANIFIPDSRWLGEDGEGDAEHQVIGQYYNGDYAILTTEGRGFQGGGYFTVQQLITKCKELGFRDAFMLDGGGSTETVVGDRQLNVIYEGTYGRIVPTYIVFNGTTVFR